MINSWMKTDSTQYVQQDGETEFIVLEVHEMAPGEYAVHKTFVELDFWGEQELVDRFLSQYGYTSVQAVKDYYLDEWQLVIAECVAETIWVTDGDVLFEGTENECCKFLEQAVGVK